MILINKVFSIASFVQFIGMQLHCSSASLQEGVPDPRQLASRDANCQKNGEKWATGCCCCFPGSPMGRREHVLQGGGSGGGGGTVGSRQ